MNMYIIFLKVLESGPKVKNKTKKNHTHTVPSPHVTIGEVVAINNGLTCLMKNFLVTERRI